MDFIDLKTQYRDLRESINARIQKVLDHGQFVLGPEVAELEGRLAAISEQSIASRAAAAPTRCRSR